MSYLHIDEVYEKNIEESYLADYLDRIDNPIYYNVLKRIKSSGTNYSRKEGLYHLVHSELYKSKQSFFTSATNELHRFEMYDAYPIQYNHAGLISLAIALLSDHEILITKIAKAGKDIDIPQRNKGSLNLMLQCAMRDDIEGLKVAMAVYEKYAIKKEWNELQLAFYTAYINQDEDRIAKVLTKLETPKLKRQSIFYKEFIDDYLSVLTTAYLKLCWRKGMEIVIDSPTVPMDMVPIEPLEKYEIEYPYLEGWDRENNSKSTVNIEEKIYEEVGPYPERNPILRSEFVSEQTINKAVNHFCTKHTEEEKRSLKELIWEAYSSPEQFDLNHKEYVQKNNNIPVTNSQGIQVLEERPFWSELTEYDDEGFFRYCNHFFIMNEMNINHEEVEQYLNNIKIGA